MKVSVVTPVFNGMPWVEFCVRSVADQGEAVLEHLIQDGGSKDETISRCNRLNQNGILRLISEKDEGMYDAINRGFRKAKGDLVLHLNCDEQLLPGALDKVIPFFESHPEIEMAFGYVLVVNPSGNLLCYRKTLLPTLWHTQVSHLATLTAATFYRKSTIEKYDLYFDTSYKVLGDADLICRALKQGVKMAILPEYTSAFTITGSNLSNDQRAVPERVRMAMQAPWPVRKLVKPLKIWHRITRMLGGVYTQSALDYRIYTPENPSSRKAFHVEKPNFRWG